MHLFLEERVESVWIRNFLSIAMGSLPEAFTFPFKDPFSALQPYAVVVIALLITTTTTEIYINSLALPW